MAKLFNGDMEIYKKQLRNNQKISWYNLWKEYGPKLCSSESKDF